MAPVHIVAVSTDITSDPAEKFRHQAERRRLLRGILDSLLLHAIILALVIGLWQTQPPEEVVLPPVTVKFEGTGASGSPGGSEGNAVMPGERNAASQVQASSAAPPASDTAPQAVSVHAAPPKPQQQKPFVHTRVAKRVTKPVEAKALPVTTARTAEAAPPTPPAQAAEAGNPAARGTGMEGSGSAGNGNFGISEGTGGANRGVGTGDDYLEAVRRWLSRYKHYPEDAIKKKQEGTVMVSFRLAHDGTVLDPEIEHSSGNPLLDQAALAMLHDGSPVPPVPQRYWDKNGSIVMPVDFTIGFFDRVFR
jgi:periplasmic protein TonB